MDFINGNKFLEIADFAIDFDHNDLITDLYKKDAVIFCKTDFISELFSFLKFSRRKYMLITHMSDYPINEVRFKSAPPSIVKWYAENAIYEDDRLIPIPLGLENHTGRSKGKFTNHQWFIENVERLKDIIKSNTLYCNWNPDTNNEARNGITQKLRDNGNGLVTEHGLSFESYCESLARYQWVVCPPGNGVDTHRVWETLYVGSYPIVLKNRIYKDYDLPILQVEKWEDVTPKLLSEFSYKWKDRTNFEQLKMDYWEKTIKN